MPANNLTLMLDNLRKSGRKLSPAEEMLLKATGYGDPALAASAVQEGFRTGPPAPASPVQGGDTMNAGLPLPQEVAPEVAQPGPDYAGELKRLRGLRDISEGLGNIYVPTAGEILLNQPRPEPFRAEGLRERIGELEDTIPEDMVSALGRAGTEIPSGTRYSQLRSIAPFMNQDSGYRREGLALARERLDFSRKKESGIGGRFDTTTTRRTQAAKRAWVKDFNTAIGNEREAIGQASKALAALRAGSATADRAALTAITRAAGEKGVLSDRDIARWEHRYGIVNKIQDIYSTAINERLSEEQRQELSGLIDEYIDVSNELIGKEAKHRAQQESKITGEDSHDLLSTLMAGREDEVPAVAPAMPTAPKGKIRVRRKSDGKTGTLDEKDFDPKKYERVNG